MKHFRCETCGVEVAWNHEYFDTKKTNPELAKKMSPLLDADDRDLHYCKISVDLSEDDERTRFFKRVLDVLMIERNKNRINRVGKNGITLSDLDEQVFRITEKYVTFKANVLGKKIKISRKKALLMALKSMELDVVDSDKFIFTLRKARAYGKRQSSMLEFVDTKNLIT